LDLAERLKKNGSEDMEEVLDLEKTNPSRSGLLLSPLQRNPPIYAA